MHYSVRVYLDRPANHPPSWIIGQVRRVADEFGYWGIRSKRRQTNPCIQRKGYLRLVWPARRLAKAYQAAVDELWGHLVSTKRFRSR